MGVLTIKMELTEKDFDYELQALVKSFFPGAICGLEVEQWQMKLSIVLETDEIGVSVLTDRGCQEGKRQVSGDGDWHKKADKTAHPYRTYYKNILKKLVWEQLRDFPEEWLPENTIRTLPPWGTMTGVRPTKIPMNLLLQGGKTEEVMAELLETYCCDRAKAELGIAIAQKEAGLLRAHHYDEGYSLYVGIPFCPTTCLYCSFPSYPFEKFGHLADDYVKALKQEISGVAHMMKDKKLTSVYIGGGTPTALEAEQLQELISHLYQCFPINDSVEFTVEAGRPDSITREKLQVLREQGVDRISVNPQTMQQKTLDLIGRKHTVEQTKQAFAMARELGFSNINMDLIIGLPGETEDDFADTLRQIEQMDPDSVTIHSLVIKRASRLRTVLEEQGALGESETVRGQRMETMLRMGEQFAKQHRYEPYYMYRQKNSAGHAGSTGQENIGYAREGSECLYNILIMEEMQTILAVGAGASTKLYHQDRGQVSRIENVKSITDYIGRVEEMIRRKADAIELL